jgi:putative colanic acid biosynthesis acetyltransferase WcaF
MPSVDLSKFDNSWYEPGGKTRRALWYIVNTLILKSSLPYSFALKRSLLRLFGAEVGRRVVIKPNVNIKYPWFLKVGDNVWIGEGVWVDNLARVEIGDNVCLSQGAYILTGNHDYKKATFDLMVSPVIIEDGVWVGAKAVVCPGTVLHSHSVITAGSVISKSAKAWTIYSGNLASAVRDRVMNV